MTMRRGLTTAVLLAVILAALVINTPTTEAATPNVIETITLGLSETTKAQRWFLGGGALSVALQLEDDFANLIPILVAPVYELARVDKPPEPTDSIQSAVINILLYYTGRTVTGLLNEWIFE